MKRRHREQVADFDFVFRGERAATRFYEHILELRKILGEFVVQREFTFFEQGERDDARHGLGAGIKIVFLFARKRGFMYVFVTPDYAGDRFAVFFYDTVVSRINDEDFVE